MRVTEEIKLDVCTTCLYVINGLEDDSAHDSEREASEAALVRDYPGNANGTGWHVSTSCHRDCPESQCECKYHEDHEDCDDECHCGTVWTDHEACATGVCLAEDGEFSFASCDVCNSGLGGGRHKATAQKLEND